MYTNIVIVGANGGIGNAFLNQLNKQYPEAMIHGLSGKVITSSNPNIKYYQIDYEDETSIIKAAQSAAAVNGNFDLIIVASGILHTEEIKPEKSLQEISYEKFQKLYAANTIFPAIIAKHFIPQMIKDRRAVFAALSARVGSISDNRLGGWYSYRASKAALNMIIKNIAIETKKRYSQGIIVGLHPGTVDTNLSKPFQSNVPNGKLFNPEYSVTKLLEVLDQLSTEDTGKCFAWDGVEILP